MSQVCAKRLYQFFTWPNSQQLKRLFNDQTIVCVWPPLIFGHTGFYLIKLAILYIYLHIVKCTLTFTLHITLFWYSSKESLVYKFGKATLMRIYLIEIRNISLLIKELYPSIKHTVNKRPSSRPFPKQFSLSKLWYLYSEKFFCFFSQ